MNGLGRFSLGGISSSKSSSMQIFLISSVGCGAIAPCHPIAPQRKVLDECDTPTASDNPLLCITLRKNERLALILRFVLMLYRLCWDLLPTIGFSVSLSTLPMFRFLTAPQVATIRGS